jgi:phosphoglycerate dehydrogenase-like enzyme
VIGASIWGIDEDLIAETGLEVIDTTEPVDAVEICERSDVVSLHCPLTDSTRNMIGAEELQALGPDGYLINTARGQVVDQDALVDALEAGDIAGAGLDVFEEEPLPAESKLTEFDNVILGSHNAQNTTEAVNEVHDRSVANLLDGLGIELSTEEVRNYRLASQGT